MSDRAFRRDPSYRKHKASGQAVVTIPDGFGGRKDYLLGKYGSKESRIEYRCRLAEWEAAGRRIPQKPSETDITINELALAYWKHAEQYYRRPDGTHTNELNDWKLSLKPLRLLYGHTSAREFGPLALESLRLAIMTGSWMDEKEKQRRTKKGHKLDCCRGVVNQRVGRIKRLFRWGASKQLLPIEVYQALSTLDGLQRGRSGARETEAVKPVPVAWVEATVPGMLPTVADMVMLQLHTGMRPGEMCVMRAIDIDMGGKVWIYRPGSDQGPAGQHKTAYRGHGRVVPLGPRAQEIVKRHLKTDVSAYLFSPREAIAEKLAALRAKRKTRVQPSQQDRSKRRPKVQAGEHYTTPSYAYSIRRAVVKANRIAAEQAAERNEEAPAPIPHWHPHQLRHTKATEARPGRGDQGPGRAPLRRGRPRRTTA